MLSLLSAAVQYWPYRLTPLHRPVATLAATQWVVPSERMCAVNEEILLQFSRQVVTCTYNFRSLCQLVCKSLGQYAKRLIT